MFDSSGMNREVHVPFLEGPAGKFRRPTRRNEVNNIILDIANASEEQAAGIDMINDSMAQINKLANENMSIVELTSKAGRSMADQAHSLSYKLDFFTIKDEYNGKQLQTR